MQFHIEASKAIEYIATRMKKLSDTKKENKQGF